MIEVKNIEDLQKIFPLIDKKIIVLNGTLGAGKTTFVKEFVKYLGIDDEVTSPTFSIQNIYGNRVYHYDLYNTEIEKFVMLGMLDELEKEGYHFIEWGDRLSRYLNAFGLDYMKIKIDLKDDKRIFHCIH